MTMLRRFGVVFALVMVGCGGPRGFTCDELVLNEGGTYTVVLGNATTAPPGVPVSGVSCGTLDSLAPGDEITLDVVRRTSENPMCVYLASGFEIGGATFTSAPMPFSTPSNIEWFAQGGRIDFGDGCTGAWEFGFAALNESYLEPSPGSPNAVAVRYFIPDSAAACAAHIGTTPGPARCDDLWEAHLVP